MIFPMVAMCDLILAWNLATELYTNEEKLSYVCTKETMVIILFTLQELATVAKLRTS